MIAQLNEQKDQAMRPVSAVTPGADTAQQFSQARVYNKDTMGGKGNLAWLSNQFNEPGHFASRGAWNAGSVVNWDNAENTSTIPQSHRAPQPAGM